MIELELTPTPTLLEARRRVATRARFNGATRVWSMTEAEYAAFWLEAQRLRLAQHLRVLRVNGRVVPTPESGEGES